MSFPVRYSFTQFIPNSPSLTTKALVLDLDQTLVNTFNDYSLLERLGIMKNPSYISLRSRIYDLEALDVGQKRGMGGVDKFWGIKRPHLTEFLTFCHSYFRTIVVWSAGQRPYVEEVVKNLFLPLSLPPPLLVYTYDDIMSGGVILKPLGELLKNPQMKARGHSLADTFIVDDREEVFGIPNPQNGIKIPPYEPSPTIDSMSTDDPSLLQLRAWFNRPEVRDSTDIRTLDKKSIFSTPV